MGRIFYIMGMSASGKDSIYKGLMEDPGLGLDTVIMYTTRPMRQGEMDGAEYFFRDEAFLAEMKAAGRVIESRTYMTVSGPWSYFTLDDGQIDLESRSYLMIGTPESYRNTREYFAAKGPDVLVPVYITVEDGERLSRAVERERQQERPVYAEVCRRYLADLEDFSAGKLAQCGIDGGFENNVFEDCLREVKEYIRSRAGD